MGKLVEELRGNMAHAGAGQLGTACQLEWNSHACANSDHEESLQSLCTLRNYYKL